MKKFIALVGVLALTLTIAGCDLIEKEIERAESIELADYRFNVAEQSVLLKITSTADEQIIEAVEVNGERYDLSSEGDDWYRLDTVPIAHSYTIDDVYYRTDVGALLTFSADYDITLDEAMDRIPENRIQPLEGTKDVGVYSFSVSEEALVTIESDTDYTVEPLEDWVWVILEDAIPVYGIVDYEESLYIIEAPDTAETYIE